jgi:hypothetical protein
LTRGADLSPANWPKTERKRFEKIECQSWWSPSEAQTFESNGRIREITGNSPRAPANRSVGRWRKPACGRSSVASRMISYQTKHAWRRGSVASRRSISARQSRADSTE